VFAPNDYIQPAVAIYLDLLNMFLAILSLLGGRRE
jgi:FtsH-binding integral membrane protein